MKSRTHRLLVGLAVVVAIGAATVACGGQQADRSVASPAGHSATSPAGHSATSPAGHSATSPAGQVAVAAFAEVVARPGTVIVDVRTPEEFRSGHLAGAVNIDVEAAGFASRVAGLHKATHYAVYCRTGRRSAVAANQMRAAGLDVTDLAGGITAWTAAGRPITG